MQKAKAAKSRINQRKAAKDKMPPAKEELGMQRMRKAKAKKPKSPEAEKPKSQEAKKPKAKERKTRTSLSKLKPSTKVELFGHFIRRPLLRPVLGGGVAFQPMPCPFSGNILLCQVPKRCRISSTHWGAAWTIVLGTLVQVACLFFSRQGLAASKRQLVRPSGCPLSFFSRQKVITCWGPKSSK